ncbi:MAG TPA: RNA polymerase sigma factor [Bacteroidales bacterium]|nr:RNA polymerase sigma factor [Bacteroidales bacterium]
MSSGNKHKAFSDLHRVLIDKCKKGNRKAQFEIYRLYHKAMYNTSLRIMNNRFDAEDVMQEAFLKAFENLDQFRGDVSFGAWLKKIVINKSLDTLRKNKRYLTEPLEDIDKEAFSETEEGETEAGPEDIRQISEEIYKLPEGYRIVLSLYLLEGYDHDEIASILGISASTSRSQYSRAKQRLLLNLKKKKS